MEQPKNVSCKADIKFEPVRAFDDAPSLHFDEKPLPDAWVCLIGAGPHHGAWLFSNKDRAEEFAWKRGLTYEFVEEDEVEDVL
jgi:hypothetical protein